MKLWNPNFITKVVTTLAVLPFTFASPAEARFTDDDCQILSSGSMVCIQMTGRNQWRVGYSSSADVTEVFDITCLGNGGGFRRYTSYGDFTQAEADAFADAFCRA